VTERTADQRLQTTCLLVLTTFVVAVALYWLKAVMIPFVLAVLVTFAINPAVGLLTEKAKIPRALSIAGVFLIGFGLFTVSGGLITSSVGQLAQNAGAYQEKITRLIADAFAVLPFERLGIEHGSIRNQLSSLPVGSMLVSLTNSIVQVLSNTVLVLIFVVFLLIGGGRAGQMTDPVWWEIKSRIERYLVAQVAISAVTGVLVGLILYVLGVDLALVFGFLAFLLNFIPSIGSIIATLLPLPIILVSPDASWTVAVLAIVLPGSVQLVIGNIITPKVMGDSLDLHPIVILMALIFWGVLWGIVGMLLATPMTAVLKILFERYELTRPVARVMAGRLGSTDLPPAPDTAEEAKSG
jgi:AI-2 transport protein TqsA